MERITLTISSELLDDTQQEASVRKNLPVRALIEEIRREFGLREGDYVLLLKGRTDALPAERSLDELGIATGAELVFARGRRLRQQVIPRGRMMFQAISVAGRCLLREATSGQEFVIEWQPALIGRPDAANPASADALAVNLGGVAQARTVSRQHAQLIESEGIFYVEGLAPRNPTFVNEQALAPDERRRLDDGDQIRVGSVVLVFELRLG